MTSQGWQDVPHRVTVRLGINERGHVADLLRWFAKSLSGRLTPSRVIRKALREMHSREQAKLLG